MSLLENERFYEAKLEAEQELKDSWIRKVAYRCLELGYYNIEDYCRFCEKNGFLLF